MKDEPSMEGEPLVEEELSAGSVEALSEAELGALGLESAGPRVDTSLHFWGFADFTSALLIRPSPALGIAQGRFQSFYVGNLNLYLSKNISESFRTMAEVRLTYLPNGSYSTSSTGYQVMETSTVDYANGQSLTRWGGIIMQRVYLEWTLHRLLAVRGGQFLTPFGIWNVDHGSPAYIPAQRPLAIVSGLFPERQTGLEFLGRWGASNDHTLGYHLTLSNGTGPISEYKDLDRNKAVGGRLYWEYFGKLYVRTGASGYYGRDTDATPTATLTGSTIALDTKLDTQSDVLSIAADLLIKYEGLTLQSEWVTLQRRYTERGRVVHQTFGASVANAASGDTFSWAGYVLAAYRFNSWYSLTPFATFQTMQLTRTETPRDANMGLVGFTVGLNVSPIESVVFKSEYGYLKTDGAPFIQDTVRVVQFLAAWAF